MKRYVNNVMIQEKYCSFANLNYAVLDAVTSKLMELATVKCGASRIRKAIMENLSLSLKNG